VKTCILTLVDSAQQQPFQQGSQLNNLTKLDHGYRLACCPASLKAWLCLTVHAASQVLQLNLHD
jgi:hypothetical protein